MRDLFPGFKLDMIGGDDARIHIRTGASAPALLVEVASLSASLNLKSRAT